MEISGWVNSNYYQDQDHNLNKIAKEIFAPKKTTSFASTTKHEKNKEEAVHSNNPEAAINKSFAVTSDKEVQQINRVPTDIDDVIAIAAKEEGTCVYKGVVISVDAIRRQMSIGNISEGRIIRVNLSNGWNLKFNRDNISDIASIIDLFSPEDTRRIMDAIALDNQALSKLQEIETEKGKIMNTTNAKNKSAETVITAKKTNSDSDKVNDNSQKQQVDAEKSVTVSKIVVNPDGSRNLVVTTTVGGVQTVLSIKLTEESKEAEVFEKSNTGEKSSKDGDIMIHNQQAVSAYEDNFAYSEGIM